MRSTGLLALLFAVAPIGCGDDLKFPDQTELPDPALNGVFPAKGFTNRKIRVQISGDGTEFTSGATVSFGPDITAANTGLSSTSDLFVDITIDGNAALGLRDVTVTDAAGTLTLAKAFEVSDPVEVLPIGPQLQGGFGQVVLINHDVEHPWLGSLQITAGTGVGFVRMGEPQIIGDFTILATATYDTDATTGKVVVQETLSETTVSQGSALTVSARTATPLVPQGKGSLSVELDDSPLDEQTKLFSFDGSSLAFAGAFPAFKGDGFGQPSFVFLTDGKWSKARIYNFDTDFFSDFFGSCFTIDRFEGDDPAPVVGSQFLVMFDVLGDSGYNFDLFIDDDFFHLPSGTALAETEPNGDNTAAQAVGSSNLVTASLATVDDEDVYKVTLEDGDEMVVQTTSGVLRQSDTQIEIQDSEGTVLASSGDSFNGEGIGGGFFNNQDFTGPLPPGDYFIHVFAGVLAAPGDDYELGITIIPGIIEEFAAHKPSLMMEAHSSFLTRHH